MFFDWDSVDDQLIKQGDNLLSLKFLGSHYRELRAMNHGKVGRLYMVKEKLCVKIHLAVDVETKQALAMLVTTDGTHDSRAFPQLLRKAERNGKACKVCADRASDSSEVYELLEQKGIEAVIKPRRNSRLDTPSEPRSKVVTLYKRSGDKL